MRKSYFIPLIVGSMLAVCICLPSCLLEIEKEEPVETKPDDVVTDIALDSKPPYRNISPEHIYSNPAYWNTAWVGHEVELAKVLKDILDGYHESHVYIPGETDCNDMAIDVWNMLAAKGVVSIIAIGNLDMEDEEFSECNHAWLLVCTEAGEVAWRIEPTIGSAFFTSTTGDCYELAVGHTTTHPGSVCRKYLGGFFYAKPSDLRADLGKRW